MKEQNRIPNAKITFRNMPPSEAVSVRIQQETEKLGKYFDGITSCAVVIEAPAKHHHHGEPFHVRVELAVPGKEIVVGHNPSLRAKRVQEEEGRKTKSQEIEAPHKDLYVTIRDSFEALRRQLRDYVECLRREVKTHQAA